MSSALKRLSGLASHFTSSFQDASSTNPTKHYSHQLSPTFWLPRTASMEPDAIAVYHKTAGGSIIQRTYAETAKRAAGFAYYIKKKGYRHVGILCPNTPAFLEALFAIGGAGAVSVGINYRLKPEDLEYIFDHADVDLILADVEFAHLLRGFQKTHPNVPVLIDLDKGSDNGPYELAVAEGLEYDRQLGGQGWDGLQTEVEDENSLIALAYTSGTTSKPKGVEYTHRSAYLGAVGNLIESELQQGLAGTERAHFLWTLPMFHAGGWMYPWAVTAARATHYTLRKVDYPEIWQLLKTERISHYNAAPTVNTLLCADPNAERLPEMVKVVVAGSPPTAYLFECMEKLNLHPTHVYGLTETYGPTTRGYKLPGWNAHPPTEKYAKMARQGYGFITSQPCRVIKIHQDESGTSTSDKIEDVAKDGKEVGEIVFAGNICTRGYYKDPEGTRKLFAGGVLHSGDLAVWHPDGSIQIVDRAKDIIISGAENISSVALESLLVTHPAILEAACVGIPDEKWGEVPKAFVTLKEGAKGTVTGQSIIEWARNESAISRFMVPKEVEILEELPKTSTGKLKKNVLRDWERGGKREKE